MSRIATLTLNPALDKSARIDNVSPDKKLRCKDPSFDPGGGGINVAAAVHRLGGDVDAFWTCGGFVGRFLGHFLDERGFRHHPIDIEGMTRENFAVFEESNEQQYRLCMPGASLSDEEVESCIEALESLDPCPDYIVLSGSVPPDVDAGVYAKIAGAMKEGCRVIVDTSGPPLQKACESGLYMIKPNIRELGQIAD